jgi:glutamine cyclotransferase
MSTHHRLLFPALLCTVTLTLGACRASTAPVGHAEEIAAPTVLPAATATPVPTVGPAPTVAPTVAQPAPTGLREYGYTVVEELPHDVGAYTQGLIVEDGIFYESTGLRGQSTVRRVDAATGQVLAGLRVPDAYFAEGLTRLGDQLYQLTWQSNVGFIYTINPDGSLVQSGEFTYPTEGWGLADEGSRLILSDGTDTIYFYDPATFTEMGRIQVTDGGAPLTRLNELEYIDGQIYANIWMTDRLAIIDPASGVVNGWVDLTGLLADADRTAMLDAWAEAGADPNWVTTNAVLNGIAYDETSGRLYVTGKLWPKVFGVELVEKQE